MRKIVFTVAMELLLTQQVFAGATLPRSKVVGNIDNLLIIKTPNGYSFEPVREKAPTKPKVLKPLRVKVVKPLKRKPIPKVKPQVIQTKPVTSRLSRKAGETSVKKASAKSVVKKGKPLGILGIVKGFKGFLTGIYTAGELK